MAVCFKTRANKFNKIKRVVEFEFASLRYALSQIGRTPFFYPFKKKKDVKRIISLLFNSTEISLRITQKKEPPKNLYKPLIINKTEPLRRISG